MTILSRLVNPLFHCSFAFNQQRIALTETSKRMAHFFLSSLVVLSLLSAASGILLFVLPEHSSDCWLVKNTTTGHKTINHTINSFDVKMNFVELCTVSVTI